MIQKITPDFQERTQQICIHSFKHEHYSGLKSHSERPANNWINTRTAYTLQDVLTVNKQSGTYYMVIPCIADADGETLYSIEEGSAQVWAENVEPRIGTVGPVGKNTDPPLYVCQKSNP